MGTLGARNALSGGGANPRPVIQVDRGGNTHVSGSNSNNLSTTGIPNVVSGAINSAGNYAALSTSDIGDASNGRAILAVVNWHWNGVSADKVRTPNVFKPFVVTVASVNTVATIWVPASGKRFRLMGYGISTSAADNVVFREAGVASANFQLNSPKLGINSPFSPNGLGNGMLAGSTNNALCIDAGAAGTTITGSVWGTEE